MTEYGNFVRVTIEDAVATIRIDRPKVNALNPEIQQGLLDAAAALREDTQVRAGIITGGDEVFAAGADIKEMLPKTYADMAAEGGRLQAACKALAELPFPTIAAMERFALGGGFEIALTCDFRVASSRIKVGQPEILLGVIPGAGGTQRLPRLIGVSKAKELVYTGRMVEADEALAIGMVDKLVDPGTTYAAALEMARGFAKGPTLALAAAKRAIDTGMEIGLDAGLKLETELFNAMFATQDRATGMASFVESGPGKATFEGR